MKVNYDNYPALKFLDKGEIDKIYHIAEDKIPQIMVLGITAKFLQNVDRFKTLQYIQRPFYDAMLRAKSSMLKQDLIDDLINDNDFSGTLIFTNRTIFYRINKSETVIISFENTNQKPRLEVFLNKQGDTVAGFASSAAKIYANAHGHADLVKDITESDIINTEYSFILLFLLFSKYSEIETKYIDAGEKEKVLKCKYLNETKLPITAYNCTWFTNLVKTGAFNVRGHFRLQPKKLNGEWTKELIWINEFKKTGYHAPARKLNVE